MTTKTNETQVMHLQKSSTPEHVKCYFQNIFALKQTGEEFPVNLDDVWPLVYSRRDPATRYLLDNFIEGIHFQSLHRSVEQTGRGGQNKIEYFISVACLEFFVASRKKEVFEVYRQVFHRAVEQAFKPILDVKPVNLEGEPYYSYLDLLGKLGYSIKSGLVRFRRRINPQEFKSYNGEWRVTAEFANYLVQMAAIRKMQETFKSRRIAYKEVEQLKQLALNFQEK